MTSAIIIVEGTTQIALTPETDWERTVLEQVKTHQGKLAILSGSVYECRGGYWRAVDVGGYDRQNFDSLILRLDAAERESPTPVEEVAP